MKPKHVAILGSTGSIGTQALDVIGAHPDRFAVDVLTSYNNAELLIRQAFQFVPRAVVIVNEEKYGMVKEALSNYQTEVFCGASALKEVVALDSINIVLSSLVGYAGLEPTVAAIQARKDIALANKETLVVAGELIMQLARRNNVQIYPVDSEHSAIYQCLIGEEPDSIEKVILTASGGPFRTYSKEQMLKVTRDQALKHPNWCMGAKVTIDSASLMNKGLEAIEARWLFGLHPGQVEVVIHPQSIIHSMVQFIDGSIKAQMGLPDMRLPIQYALGFPGRLQSSFPRFSFISHPNLNFETPDLERFPNLRIALEAMREAGNMPCVMNAANEVAVQAFLCDQIGFMDIPAIIEKTIQKCTFVACPGFDDYASSDAEAREITRSLL